MDFPRELHVKRVGPLPRELAACPVKADFAAIREVEFDCHLEKLSAEDYRELRRRLEAQGLEVIRAIGVPAAGTRRRADPGVSPS